MTEYLKNLHAQEKALQFFAVCTTVWVGKLLSDRRFFCVHESGLGILCGFIVGLVIFFQLNAMEELPLWLKVKAAGSFYYQGQWSVCRREACSATCHLVSAQRA
jgi:hypothetical protein